MVIRYSSNFQDILVTIMLLYSAPRQGADTKKGIFSMTRHAKKNLYHVYGPHTFFLEYPFGTPYLELSSEIPAQDFNLLVNIDNFFPVFLLITIGNSFHLFKFTLHL